MQRLKHFILALAVAFSGALILTPTIAGAATTDSSGFKSGACGGIQALNGSGCNGANASGIDNIIRWVVQILSVIVGVAAVIMIVVGGLKFITSGGDANNTASARNTILYAIIGLVIVALAQVIVHFVLNKVATVH